MKKKILIGSIVTIVLLSMSLFVFSACNDKEPEPRAVIIEVINPNTGEVLKENDHIDLPTEKTLVEVRIKDKQTGKYLTDDDLPENTIKGSFTVGFSVVDGNRPMYTNGYWSQEYNPVAFDDYYEISVHFDCWPKQLPNLDIKKFYRKYEMTTEYIRFYINR